MAKVTEQVLVQASLADAWTLYFDRSRWAAWVDGFGGVDSEEGYPEAGGTLAWHSTPAGRGQVRERVLDHEPRTLHRVAFTDPESSGELTTRLALEGETTRVTLELDYALASRGPFAWLTDRLFVRSQIRGSLRRTLLRFKHEAEEAATASSSAAGNR